MSSEPSDADRSAPSSAGVTEPNLLRFGLRQWFYFISAIVLVCALLASLKAIGAIVVGSILTLLLAHVFGTFLGTRLRDTSAEVVRWKARPGSGDADHPVSLPQPVALAEIGLPQATTLAEHTASARRSRWAAALGAIAGGLLGGWGIHALAGPQVTWPGLLLGAVSCSVIGAWGTLLWISFWAIIRQAWRSASDHD